MALKVNYGKSVSMTILAEFHCSCHFISIVCSFISIFIANLLNHVC